MRRGYLLLMMLPALAAGEIICSLGSAANYKSSGDQAPSPDAMQLIKRVSGAYESICRPKCPEVAVFRNATAPNAMLVLNESQAKLVYSPAFFSSAYGQYGEGAILAIVAHVYGHAMADTTPAAWVKRSWSPELRADAWAGCALAKLALSPNDLKSAYSALTIYRSASLPVVRAGYAQCQKPGTVPPP